MNAVTDGATRVVSNPETEGWNRADNFRVARDPDTIAEVTKRSTSPVRPICQVGSGLVYWEAMALPLRSAFVTINSVSSIA